MSTNKQSTNNKQVEKSDVGIVLDSFNALKNEVIVYQNYMDFTDQIKFHIETIQESYIEIGSRLIEMNSKEIFKLGQYKDIYDYANDQFALSKTTVNNVMNIVNRFCNESHQIKDEYSNYSFSSLVEMLPLDDSQIKELSPSLTVKEIRSKKQEQKIVKLLDKTVNGSDLFKTILDAFNEYDFGIFEKESQILKSRYIHENNELELEIMFSLKHKMIDESFKFEYSWNRLRFIAQSFWKIGYIEEPKDVREYFKEFYNEVLTRNKGILERKDGDENNTSEDSQSSSNSSNEVQVSPGYFKLSNLKRAHYQGDSFHQLVKNFIATLSDEFYYESVGSSYENNITLFGSGKRHKTKNPPLYQINNLNDPLLTEIVVFGENGEENNRLKVFDDIEDYINKKIEIFTQTII